VSRGHGSNLVATYFLRYEFPFGLAGKYKRLCVSRAQRKYDPTHYCKDIFDHDKFLKVSSMPLKRPLKWLRRIVLVRENQQPFQGL
jgi:hypothetical protein